MTNETITLLIDAALFGAATAGVCLVLLLIGVCIWQVWQAVYSLKAVRRREFKKRLTKYSAHNRRILGLSPKKV